MIEKVTILGAGSQLYKKLIDASICVEEYHTCDLELLIKRSVKRHLIVFSLIDGKAIKSLYERYNGKITIIGSVAAIHPLAQRFSYSRLKKAQLDAVLKVNDKRLKYIMCGEFFPKDIRVGKRALTNPSTFWDTILNDESTNVLLRNFMVTGDSNKFSAIVGSIEQLFAPLSSQFLKKYSNHLYGYNLYMGEN